MPLQRIRPIFLLLLALCPGAGAAEGEMVFIAPLSSAMPFADFTSGQLSGGILGDVGDAIAHKLGRQARYLSIPGKRVDQTLSAAGIAADLRQDVRGSAREARQAAVALARKRRLGPYGPPPADRAAREKQIAVLLRAGHRLDFARQVVEAGAIAGLEAWAEEED